MNKSKPKISEDRLLSVTLTPKAATNCQIVFERIKQRFVGISPQYSLIVNAVISTNKYEIKDLALDFSTFIKNSVKSGRVSESEPPFVKSENKPIVLSVIPENIDKIKEYQKSLRSFFKRKPVFGQSMFPQYVIVNLILENGEIDEDAVVNFILSYYELAEEFAETNGGPPLINNSHQIATDNNLSPGIFAN